MKDTISYRSPTYYELGAPPELDWRVYRDQDWHEYRQQWDLRAQNGKASDFPLHLDIDPTNRCTLRCPMCPRTWYLKEGREAWNPSGVFGDMDFDFYTKLIEEGVSSGLKSVKLNFLGEPLLHPLIVDMVSLAARSGLWVMINTNATLLTAELSEKLLEAGLTDIFFSFDSPYPSEYEAVRVGADYQKTLGYIKTFMEIKDSLGKKAVQTRASMVLPEKNQEELARIKADYLKLFRDLKVAEIGFGLPTVMGFDYGALGRVSGFICPDIFRRAFVFWDGPVSPCCGDWERRLIMGDARSESLASIWQGSKYKQLRQAHWQGCYDKIPACQDCSVPSLSLTDS